MEGSRPTACDTCRLRKVRCDRTFPCNNCRFSGQPCTFTGAGQKPKETRQRIHLSSKYEQKIDLIEARLRSIESLLLEKRSETQVRETSTSASAPLQSDSPDTQANATVFDQDELEAALEGPSSLEAHAVTAQAFAMNILDSEALEPPQACDPQEQFSIPPQRTDDEQSDISSPPSLVPLPPHRQMALPPTSAIVDVLRHLKEKPPISFVALRCFVPVDQFIDTCRKVFFAIDDYTDAEFIIATSGLYYLFHECYGTVQPDHLRREYVNHGDLCRHALEAAVDSLGAFLPAKMDSVQALISSSCHAIEVSKPWLAWRLSALAAHLCFTLGWHNNSATLNDDAPMRNSKILLFWHAYCLERGLSLRLGRASIIHDYDITLDSRLNGHHLPGPWPEMLSYWVGIAKLQGKVYQHLYSGTALSSSSSSISARADHLLAELDCLGQECSYVRFSFLSLRYQPSQLFSRFVSALGCFYGAWVSRITQLIINCQIFDPSTLRSKETTSNILASSDKITFFSTATLICRAKTAKEASFIFSEDCLINARKALDCHNECMRLTSDDQYSRALYMHWRILQSPFIPLIVVFGNLVKTQNLQDLDRLRVFVESLETSKQLSKLANRLHHVSLVLHKVACLYCQQVMGRQEIMAAALFNNDGGQSVPGSLSLPPYEDALTADGTPGALVFSQTDDLFFGPEQILGPLEPPFDWPLPGR